MSNMHDLLVSVDFAMDKLASENPGSVAVRERIILETRDKLAVLQRYLREQAKLLDAITTKHIDNFGDIEMGEGMRLYVTTVQSWKSNDDRDVLQEVLEANGGDLSVLSSGPDGVLVSQPWKSGAVKKCVGEKIYFSLFTSHKSFDVATGKSLRSVRVADDSWQ